MTPKQAIEILDNAVSQMALNRQQHATLVEALQVLVKSIEEKQDEKND
jgi:hypothetical protein